MFSIVLRTIQDTNYRNLAENRFPLKKAARLFLHRGFTTIAKKDFLTHSEKRLRCKKKANVNPLKRSRAIILINLIDSSLEMLQIASVS